MFSLLRSRKKLPKEKAEPAPPRPGPAQHNLSQQCGIETWSPIIDWTSLEAQQADLERRLASYDSKRPATTEGIVPGHPGTTSNEPSVPNNKPAAGQRQGKQPVTQGTTGRPDVDRGFITQQDEQYQRKTTRTSRVPTAPPVPLQTSSAHKTPSRDKYDRVVKEESRYVNKPNAGRPGLTRRPAMRVPSTSRPSAPAPYSAPSTTARFTEVPSAPAPIQPAPYPAPVPRWMDPHHIEAELARREVARHADDSNDNAWAKRREEYTRQVEKEEVTGNKPASRRVSAREAPKVTAKTNPMPRETSSGEGPVFGGEHPAVAFARQAAKQDYERRKAREPYLIDPDTMPIDTTWQERTYSGRAVGAAWVKLEKERGHRDPTYTSAVPGPLTIQKGVADMNIERPARNLPQDARYRAYQPPTPQMSYCHAAGEYRPGGHLRSLDRGCTCAYTSVSAQRDVGKSQRPSASGQVVNSDKEKSRGPQVHFSTPPHPRYNATGYMPDDDGDSSDSDILAPARPRRDPPPKRVTNGVRGPNSSVSWTSASSAGSSSSPRSGNIDGTLGVADQSDGCSVASFVCQDAARIEGRAKM